MLDKCLCSFRGVTVSTVIRMKVIINTVVSFVIYSIANTSDNGFI